MDPRANKSYFFHWLVVQQVAYCEKNNLTTWVLWGNCYKLILGCYRYHRMLQNLSNWFMRKSIRSVFKQIWWTSYSYMLLGIIGYWLPTQTGCNCKKLRKVMKPTLTAIRNLVGRWSLLLVLGIGWAWREVRKLPPCPQQACMSL